MFSTLTAVFGAGWGLWRFVNDLRGDLDLLKTLTGSDAWITYSPPMIAVAVLIWKFWPMPKKHSTPLLPAIPQPVPQLEQGPAFVIVRNGKHASVSYNHIEGLDTQTAVQIEHFQKVDVNGNYIKK